MTNLKFALFFNLTLIVMAACGPNTVLPDATGRVCVPDALIAGQTCQLAGCDADSSAYFCSADARGQECRLYPGRTCVAPSATCLGGGTECVVGVGGCAHHGVSSCPVGSTVASLCSAVADRPVPEICADAIDNDCNGVVDNGCPVCTPSGAEICDNVNNDCDDFIDEGCDDDGDDYCDATMQMGASGSIACPNTPRGSTIGNDCDDTNASRHPYATETCGDGIDQDCNGADLMCPDVPTAEICDGRDNDFDGSIDEGCDDDDDGYCDAVMTMGVSGAPTCLNTPVGYTFGNDCDDSNASRHPYATETCGDGIDQDCNGADLACPRVCTVEVCNGSDDDCDGLIDEGVCGTPGGALVGNEICVSYGFDMPPLASYNGSTVVHADITIYGCDDVPRTIRIDSYTPVACITLSTSCRGWLATTYSESGYSFADMNYVGSWYAPDGTSYYGYNASDSRLSGTLSSSSNIRVFTRRYGLADRELTDRSWIAYDPSGATVPYYARTHAGERVMRLMVPVREDSATYGVRPPDRY